MNLAAFHLLLTGLLPVADISVLIDLLQLKNVNYVVNFECESAAAALATCKKFNQNQIRIANMKSNFNASFSLPFYYSKVALILNSSCANWSSALQYLDEKHVFKNPFTWFIITKDINATGELLSRYPMEIDSTVILIHKVDGSYHLYDAYNTGYYTNGVFEMQKIGFWNTTLYLELSKNIRLNNNVSKRMNLSGVVLRAMVVVTQKVVNETFEEYVERSRLYKQDTLHKLKYFTLLKYLRDMYNFSYDLRRTNSWGYLHNGSFDGMIGTLQREETDIGGSPIFLRLERALVVDYTIEVWQSRPVFIMRHPKHPSGYFSMFSRPLTTRVWSCIFMVLAVSSAILSMMLKLRALRIEGDDKDSSASLAILTIWSAICQQGSSISRSSNAIKLVMFVTCVFSLTIYQYYNATVVSTLLHEPPKNIRTPTDLLKSNLKTGVHDVLYNRDFFKRTTDPIALRMYNKKIATAAGTKFFSLEYGMALVKKGGYAFLVDNSIAYAIMRVTFDEAELCEAHEIALYPPQNMVAVVKKGSPYREHFSYGLRRMWEAGLMKRLKRVWDEEKPSCVRTPDSSLISVSLREFSAPLAALAGGWLAAATVLALEIIVYKLTLLRKGFRR